MLIQHLPGAMRGCNFRCRNAAAAPTTVAMRPKESDSAQPVAQASVCDGSELALIAAVILEL